MYKDVKICFVLCAKSYGNVYVYAFPEDGLITMKRQYFKDQWGGSKAMYFTLITAINGTRS